MILQANTVYHVAILTTYTSVYCIVNSDTLCESKYEALLSWSIYRKDVCILTQLVVICFLMIRIELSEHKFRLLS